MLKYTWYTNCENKLASLCKMFVVKTEKELDEVLGEIMEMNAKEKLVKEVKKFSDDDANIGLYTKLSHQEILKNTLVYEAEERGRKEGITLTAQKMLDKGVNLQVIQEVTGLSIEEIEKTKL